jgi:hypothetical protein
MSTEMGCPLIISGLKSNAHSRFMALRFWVGVGKYQEKLKSRSSRTIEFWARYIPGQILCRTQGSRQKKTNAKLTRPKPKEKVGFKWLPSTPGFVPFSDNRYRSGTKSSGLS